MEGHMKTYVKGAAVSFLMFSLTLFLFSFSSNEDMEFIAVILPYALPIVYAVCFATEIFITLAEWKWYGRKFDWFIVPAALIVSFPFWNTPPFYIPILTGAIGYYFGRKLPDKPFVFGMAPLPVLLVIVVIVFIM
jgi:hypothetical protein